MASSNQVWYRKVFGIPVHLEQPWISLDGNTNTIKSYDILVNKSTRFFNERINYEFLNCFEHVGFVGLAVEFDDFKKRNNLLHIEHVLTSTALDFALLITKSKIFLGNQSVGFAIAEGLKVPRALEVYEPVPVVIPIGGHCIEYVYTYQIQAFVEDYFKQSCIKKFPDHMGGFVESVLNPTRIKLKHRILKKLGFKIQSR
jgi:hypothetical protein